MQETFFERLAREKRKPVEAVRKQIAERIKAGLNDPNPEIRAQWEMIPHAGEQPTPDEWLEFALKRIYEEGCEDLLRQYLTD